MNTYLTPSEAASILKTTPKTIRTMCAEGVLEGAERLNPAKPKSPWRIPERAVYERKKTTTPAPRPPRSRKWREDRLAA